MNITFERATPDDAAQLVAVQIAAFHHDTVLYGVPEDGPPGYNSIDSALEKIARDDYYKIVYEGNIIGGIVVFVQGDGHYHLDLLYLHPDYHNKGIGTQALHFLEATYPATKWTLDTPLYALRNQHFYEKFGYKEVGRVQYDIVVIAYEKLM
jgi:GNAT superfamily N-acetyltransferase